MYLKELVQKTQKVAAERVSKLIDIINETRIYRDLSDDPTERARLEIKINRLLKSLEEADKEYKIIEETLSSPDTDIYTLIPLIRNQIEDERNKSKSSGLFISEFPLSKDENFTGRIEEKEELLKRLKDGRTCHVRSFIFGMGGIGKTALAVETVHEIADKKYFKDGIIWYRVKNEEIDKILFNFANIISDAAGIFNPLREHRKEEYYEIFKRHFSGYDILFVLDNADYDLESVIRPLLYSLEGFSLLLTSRRELPLPASAHVINLGALGHNECIEFFAKILGNDLNSLCESKFEIDELCKELGYLPLAIKLSAYYIKNQRCTLSDYLDNWYKRKNRLSLLETETLDIEKSRRNVSVCFELSLRSLNELDLSLFLWMGLFSSSFSFNDLFHTLSKSHNEQLKQIDRDTVRSTVVLFKQLSLIDRIEGVGDSIRIYLHPLLHEFAIEKRGGDINEEKKNYF